MKELLFRLAIVIGLLTSVMAHAADDDTLTRQATGYGDTPQAAISHALLEASRQGLGTVVTLDPDFRQSVVHWIRQQHEDTAVTVGHRYSQPEPRTPSIAAIRSYAVMQVSAVDDRFWKAQVEATLARHQGLVDEKAHLPTLSVAPLTTSDRNSQQRAQSLHHSLVTALTQTGRVRVLDREHDHAIARERSITRDSLLLEEQLRQGQDLGADILLVAELERFTLGRPDRTFYGARFAELEPVIRIAYRLLETANRQILHAGTFVYRESPASLRQRLLAVDIDPDKTPERIGELLYPSVARQMTAEIMETLYPLRILAAQDENTLYISQGSGSLEKGQQLSVHQQIRQRVDPDTGLTLKLEGPSLARLEIQQIMPDYAIATLISGDNSALDGDDILLRPIQTDKAPIKGGPGRPITPGSSSEPLKWD